MCSCKHTSIAKLIKCILERNSSYLYRLKGVTHWEGKRAIKRNWKWWETRFSQGKDDISIASAGVCVGVYVKETVFRCVDVCKCVCVSVCVSVISQGAVSVCTRVLVAAHRCEDERCPTEPSPALPTLLYQLILFSSLLSFPLNPSAHPGGRRHSPYPPHRHREGPEWNGKDRKAGCFKQTRKRIWNG